MTVHRAALSPTNVRPSPYRTRRPATDERDGHDGPTDDGVLPLVRRVGDEVRVLDGMARVRAAEREGVRSLDVCYLDVDDERAERTVHLTGEPGWHQNPDVDGLVTLLDVDAPTLRRALGCPTEIDRIETVLDPFEGVGRRIARSLAAEFDTAEDVLDASPEELTRANGVGPMTARHLCRWLDRE